MTTSHSKAVDDLRTALKRQLGSELEVNVQSTKRREPSSYGEMATVSVIGMNALLLYSCQKR